MAFLTSFKFAVNGILACVKSERNFRIHIVVFVALMLLARLYGFSVLETAILVFAAALVIISEIFNTAVEYTVNLLARDYDPLAKLAKDVSAGAVLTACLFSCTIGVSMFFNFQKIIVLFDAIVNIPQNLIFCCLYAIISLLFVLFGGTNTSFRQ